MTIRLQVANDRVPVVILFHIGAPVSRELFCQLSVVEYLKNPPERAKLEQLYRDAGITPRQGLRLRGSPAEEMGLTDEDATADQILDSLRRYCEKAGAVREEQTKRAMEKGTKKAKRPTKN